MSTRLLMNIALGTVTVLLLAAVGVVMTSNGDRDAGQAQVDLALRQQTLIQDLNQEVAELAAADNLLAVNNTRGRLGRTIVEVDRNLAALVNGGSVENPNGVKVPVGKVKNSEARDALQEAARVWLDTGMPLADLAAGEFSIFSAAGQEAVAGLTRNSPSLANQMGIAATAMQLDAEARVGRAGFARYAVMVLGGLLGALVLLRLRPMRATAPEMPTGSPKSFSAPAAPAESADHSPTTVPETVSAPVQSLNWERHSSGTYTSPVDFDNVNASVDQLSVDMNTIAGSTDKMRLAIDSVGHALQGMLYSLNEMAQDTAEGYKIVRGANNAASYTASAAEELAASSREMSRVVARVTQLALKTKQIAAQIDAEAVSTGSTGEAFTSVVAAEVKGLAHQTSAATQEIDSTVSEILATARQYEEAIGQIIKNISAINKVSQHLGELMLHPPAAGVAGTPLPAALARPLDPGLAAPAIAAPAPVQAQAPAPPPAPEPAPAPAPEPVNPAVAAAAEELEDPFEAEPTPEEVAEETSAAIEEAVEEAPAAADPEPSGSSGNVFMLGGGSKKPRKSLTIPEAPAPAPVAAEPEAAKPESAAAPEPAPVEEEDTGSNIFMLNKPKKAAAPAPAAEEPKAEEPKAAEPTPEPAPEPEPAAPEAAAEEEDSGSNIFMLNKPKKPAASAPAEPAPEPEPEPAAPEAAAEEEPETVPAGGEEPANDGGSNGNIFMLKKPNK
jgi:hypothetical protein